MRTTEQPSGFLRLFYKTTKISAILISVVLIVSLSSNSYFLNYHACSTGPPVDECTLGLHDCDSKANSSCVDTRFYYKCECNPGFRETDDSQCEGICMRFFGQNNIYLFIARRRRSDGGTLSLKLYTRD